MRSLFFKFVLVAALIPGISIAYEVPTHQSITRAAIKTYESIHGDVFNSWQEEVIVDGSGDEDDNMRFMRHFYDPINQVGLKALYPTSKEWATSNVLQASGCVHTSNFNIAGCANYDGPKFESPTDASWSSAVFTYAHKGEIDGLRKLGHTIHLLQDATVPAHVRNDAHPSHEVLGSRVGNPDYYEHYSGQYFGSDVRAVSTASLPKFRSAGHAFDVTAHYTNTNYYSGNTIFNYTYPNETNLEIENEGLISYEVNRSSARVAVIESFYDIQTSKETIIKIIKEEKVLSDHWSDLSQRAVLASAGAIELFMREVAVEKQSLALLKQNEDSKKNLAQKTWDSVLSFFNEQSATQTASAVSAFDSTPVFFDVEDVGHVQIEEPAIEVFEISDEEMHEESVGRIVEVHIPENDPRFIAPPQVLSQTIVSIPVAGSAPGGVSSEAAPQPLLLSGGAGQGGGGSPIPESSTPPAVPASASVLCTLPEVLNTDSTACVIPDTTPPTLTVTLSGCLSLTTTDTTLSCFVHVAAPPTLSWVAEDGSVVSINGTITTNTSASLSANTTLVATDTSGNTATKTIEIITHVAPVIISEVGYPLDAPHDTTRQYVELYNPTDATLDLSELSLESSRTEGDPPLPLFSLPLIGTIQPRSYFLITNDYDIADTTEDMTTVWTQALSNTSSLSHQLILRQGTTTLDSFELSCPTLSTTCHPTGHPFALERSTRQGNAIDYAYSLEQNNSQFVFTSGSVRFVGSPGRRNTADYVIATLSDTLSTLYSPYYSSALDVPMGATATIDAGVTLTMRGGGSINVSGTLIINGTTLEPVIIANADRWSGITVSSGASLTASHAQLGNAGIGNAGSDNAAIKNRGGTVSLTDVAMTDVQPNGFFQDEGTSILTNVSIETQNYPENAVKVRGGSFSFTGGVLSNFSDFGFHITGTPVCTISNITITGVRNARTSGSDVLCAWGAVSHNGSPL